MKKILVISCFLVGCLIAVGAPTANATAVLNIWDDQGHYLMVSDGSANDIHSSNVGDILYSGSMGVWDIIVNLGITKPVDGSASSPQMHLTVAGHSTAAGGLHVNFSDLGFVFNGSEKFSWGGATVGSLGALVGVTGDDPLFSGVGSSGSADVDVLISSIQRLYIQGDITHDGAGSSSVDIALTPVPEPGTMMLLGSGLVGLAGWGRKKFRK